MKKKEFEKEYFTSGNFLTHSMAGKFTTYYWARRFYAHLMKYYLKKGKVLEIGCSYGDLLSHFGGDYEVFGVEVSEFACKEARKRYPRLKIDNQDALAYLKSLPNKSFNAVIQICVIPHMDDPEAVFKEIGRVLKKGGIFFSVTPNPSYPLNRLKGEKSGMYLDKTHKHILKNQEWINLIKKNGLKIINKGSNGWWDVPYLPVIPRPVQLLAFGWTSIIQVLLGRLIFPDWFGVDLILVAEKNEDK